MWLKAAEKFNEGLLKVSLFGRYLLRFCSSRLQPIFYLALTIAEPQFFAPVLFLAKLLFKTPTERRIIKKK